MTDQKKIILERISEGAPLHLQGFGVFVKGDSFEVAEEIAEYLINGGHFAKQAKAKTKTQKKKDN